MRSWIKSECYNVETIYIVLIEHLYVVNAPLVVWLHVCSMEGFTGKHLIKVCGFIPSLLKVKTVCVALKRTDH